MSYIISKRWSVHHSWLFCITFSKIPFILSIILSYIISYSSISRDWIIALMIFTVNALNLGWFTSKYWNNISISFNLLKITTNAEFLSTTTDKSLRPKRGIGSLSERISP
jgi:hypothetical protein